MAEDPSSAELKQPKTTGPPPRYFYLVTRKSSQSPARESETGSASEREARVGHDSTKSHRRDTSITSQESFDTSVPISPFRKPKKVTISPPIDIRPLEPTSQTHGGSGAQGTSPRQPFRRTCSLKLPTDSTMADQVDKKPTLPGLVSEHPDDKTTHPQHHSDSREGSQVKIEETARGLVNGVDSVEDRPVPQVNGSGDGQVQDDAGSHTDKDQDHDDDDSYPDLDDIGMEEIHKPPPRKPNSGIRWAPWNVPFRRRAQTLVVLMHSLSIVATASLFFAFCANPLAWPLLVIYLLYVLSSKAATDGSLNYRSEWFRKSYIWHFFADYYPARLHKTHDLPATRKYIFGYHPHGIISHGAWAAFATDALGFSEKFPGITNSLLTLDSNFRIPFYREYVLSMGVRSVSKESIVNILNKGGPNGEGMGRAVTVVVGGARESLEAQPGMMRLILAERKGFVKLAVRCGADLVPVLAFGENDLYDQLQPHEYPFMHRIQMFILKAWKFTLPFLHGRGIFNYDVGLMPYRRPLNIVVGAPIKVRQSSSVNMEEVNRLHGLYVAELEKLWDRYKGEFAPDRKQEMQILS
ncbi:diacylglycerol acyltransferase-domain-containing protein [Nemania sp. NC0429]|nr:diacylglycerol acyltransferase-domain-containing protein [Nemania sp. NC0429]